MHCITPVSFMLGYFILYSWLSLMRKIKLYFIVFVRCVIHLTMLIINFFNCMKMLASVKLPLINHAYYLFASPLLVIVLTEIARLFQKMHYLFLPTPTERSMNMIMYDNRRSSFEISLCCN